MVRKIRSKLSIIQSRHLSEVCKNKNVILSQKQPKNLLRLSTRARFSTEINAFQQQNGLFKCIDKHCKICSLYIVEGYSFIMSNNMRWQLRSHVTCYITFGFRNKMSIKIYINDKITYIYYI